MNQLRDHYERQDTEDLLQMAEKDLTDEARVVLIEVLGNRGVASSDVEAARQKGIAEEVQAAEVEGRLAARWERLLAFMIDVCGSATVLWVALWPLRTFSEGTYANAVTVLWFCYFLLRDSIPGQSFGKRLLGLRVVEVESGLSSTWVTSLVRNVPHLFLVIDALFALGDRRRRLGDILAKTMVVRADAAAGGT